MFYFRLNGWWKHCILRFKSEFGNLFSNFIIILPIGHIVSWFSLKTMHLEQISLENVLIIPIRFVNSVSFVEKCKETKPGSCTGLLKPYMLQFLNDDEPITFLFIYTGCWLNFYLWLTSKNQTHISPLYSLIVCFCFLICVRFYLTIFLSLLLLRNWLMETKWTIGIFQCAIDNTLIKFARLQTLILLPLSLKSKIIQLRWIIKISIKIWML